MKLELNVVRFENEDVIATSDCNGLGTPISFLASVQDGCTECFYEEGDPLAHLGVPVIEYGANHEWFQIDMNDTYTDANGNHLPVDASTTLNVGTWYHYIYHGDTDQIEWFECSNPAHHAD